MHATAVKDNPVLILSNGERHELATSRQPEVRTFLMEGTRVRLVTKRFVTRTEQRVLVVQASTLDVPLFQPRGDRASDDTVRWVKIGGNDAPWFFRDGPDECKDQVALKSRLQRMTQTDEPLFI